MKKYSTILLFLSKVYFMGKKLNLLPILLCVILLASCSKPKPVHNCGLKYCTFIGQTNFTTGCGACNPGSDCWELDRVHFDHPLWSYDQCEDFLFAPMKN